jgi:hypothetical protein
MRVDELKIILTHLDDIEENVECRLHVSSTDPEQAGIIKGSIRGQMTQIMTALSMAIENVARNTRLPPENLMAELTKYRRGAGRYNNGGAIFRMGQLVDKQPSKMRLLMGRSKQRVWVLK